MHTRTITMRGTTLLEILLVIAIIGILASLLLPAVGKTLERGKRTYCQNNLRQTYLLVAAHAADHQGLIPAATTPYPVMTMPSDRSMWVIARAISEEPTPKFLRCPSDRRTFPTDTKDLSYYWNGLSLGKPLAAMHPSSRLASEKWFWHASEQPRELGGNQFLGMATTLKGDGSTAFEEVPFPILKKETGTEAR